MLSCTARTSIASTILSVAPAAAAADAETGCTAIELDMYEGEDVEAGDGAAEDDGFELGEVTV